MTHHQDRDVERFDEQGNTRPAGGNYITSDTSGDGIDRRGFLRCMAWAGTAAVWGMSGGVPKSFAMSRLPFLSENERKSIFFAQISDSHIGFSKDANADVTATLQEAVAKQEIANESALGCYVTLSIGIATYQFPGAGTANTLLETSDQALYTAKERGRNRIELSALPAFPNTFLTTE